MPRCSALAIFKQAYSIGSSRQSCSCVGSGSSCNSAPIFGVSATTRQWVNPKQPFRFRSPWPPPSRCLLSRSPGGLVQAPRSAQNPLRVGHGRVTRLHSGRLFIVNDNEHQAELLALDAKTGKELWRAERDEKSNRATPFIWENGRRTDESRAWIPERRQLDSTVGGPEGSAMSWRSSVLPKERCRGDIAEPS